MTFGVSEATQWLALGQPFALESGCELPEVQVAYRTWGRLDADGGNAVIVCHALTGSADADEWWPALFGRGRALDGERDFIVCSNVLGGCYGTTGPSSFAPDGQRWATRFPAVTVRDQVRLQMVLADRLGIRRIRFVIGGSMGGLQALEWALLDPRRVEAVVSIAAAGRHPAWCVVWSEAQRLALLADPRFRDGHYPPDDPPLRGLAAARAIAMATYRSPASLGARFGRASGRAVFGHRAKAPDDYAVRNWLRHHGEALARRFDANSYLTLLEAMDTHDLARGRGPYEQVVQRIRQPVLIGSVRSDGLYVPGEQYGLARLLPRGEIFEIDSEQGHDGFLIDAARFEPRLRRFVDRCGRDRELSIRPLREDGRLRGAC
ncbi:homoserine O-acetyltransferase [Accumulibacter sp.]|uniref:homoserine O-acetyltransferase MetX n=1 Tax=Accumulibacter sp. TaxID=2053492 RepID=UPI0025E1514B|nr:homoserine O-acetyltransferase [Accumulibacter sp.]MCM8595518.1 homoserine O-acetyltransferase [Accumulibacter sp.]MCM8626829.1 homoserine O-acetyltransferase [Accumulibacter sp.]MDS4049665.1 homoserine O-acetyltransferase [Accumulibacter sp.]